MSPILFMHCPASQPVTRGRNIGERHAANPLWRAPRIHGELKMLGTAISERTVSRLLRTLRRPPNQTWRTFLHNHIGQMVSTDFFTVPTITMKVLFVFIVLAHDRRKVLHFHITEHPTGTWTATANPIAGYRRDSDRTAKPLAESIRRETHRLDSKGMSEPLNHPERPTSQESVVFIFPLLPRIGNPLDLGKQCPFPREALKVGKIVAIP